MGRGNIVAFAVFGVMLAVFAFYFMAGETAAQQPNLLRRCRPARSSTPARRP